MINTFKLSAIKKLETPYLKITTNGFDLIYATFDLDIIEDFVSEYEAIKTLLDNFKIFKIQLIKNNLIITLKTK